LDLTFALISKNIINSSKIKEKSYWLLTSIFEEPDQYKELNKRKTEGEVVQVLNFRKAVHV